MTDNYDDSTSNDEFVSSHLAPQTEQEPQPIEPKSVSLAKRIANIFKNK